MCVILERYLNITLGRLFMKNYLHGVKYVLLAKWHYNTSLQSATGITPSQVLYGKTPPSTPLYILASTNIEAADTFFATTKKIFEQLLKNFLKAQ